MGLTQADRDFEDLMYGASDGPRGPNNIVAKENVENSGEVIGRRVSEVAVVSYLERRTLLAVMP